MFLPIDSSYPKISSGSSAEKLGVAGRIFVRQGFAEDHRHRLGRQALRVFDREMEVELAVRPRRGQDVGLRLAGRHLAALRKGRRAISAGTSREAVGDVDQGVDPLAAVEQGEGLDQLGELRRIGGCGIGQGFSTGTPTRLPHSVQLPS